MMPNKCHDFGVYTAQTETLWFRIFHFGKRVMTVTTDTDREEERVKTHKKEGKSRACDCPDRLTVAGGGTV